MKKMLSVIALAVISFSSLAQVNKPTTAIPHHGGGNGGDELELELKKRSLQIGQFVKSEMGAKVFKMLNPTAVIDTVNNMDIDVTDKDVYDRYNTVRTCVNYPERQLIECNLARMTALKSQKKDDILTATLFHEILGLMELELGYQENVSLYPISSKIIPYSDIVITTPISESDIRPEYYGLDNRSYGMTYVNKKTKESVRLICLNNNVEIHRCRNYSVVRNANGMQVPLNDKVISLSKAQIETLQLSKATEQNLAEMQAKLDTLKARGFKFLTLKGNFNGGYRYGVGAGQGMHKWEREEGEGFLIMFYSVVPIMYPMWAVDTTVETGKQVINIVSWPVKAVVNLFKVGSQKRKLKKINKRLDKIRNVLNQGGDLSLVGKSESLKEKDYNQLVNDMKLLLDVM